MSAVQMQTIAVIHPKNEAKANLWVAVASASKVNGQGASM